MATDAEGNFVFANLEPGDYRISAQRDNFQYNAPRRPEPLTLKPGDAKKDVVMKMTPLGAITGVVRDENGDPVQNIQISLLAWQYTASGRQLANRGNTTASDIGEYRLFGVPAGKYYLRANAPMRRASDDDETFVTTFYPGALDAAGATALDLRPGQEIRGIDLTVRRARTVTARGRVVKPMGATSLPLMSIAQNMDGSSMNTMNQLTDPEGKFEWRGMIPGSYTLGAQTSVGDRRYFAKYALQAGSKDIDNIELRLVPTLDVKGVIRIEGAPEIKPGQVTVMFGDGPGRSASTMPARTTPDGRPAPGSVAEDGTFTVSLDPEFYRVSATAPGTLYLKSVVCGSKEVTETGFDLSGGACDVTVVMSPNSGQLEGQVTDADSQPAPFVQVTLIPMGSLRTDLFKAATTDASGHFRISAIVPGSYKAYAWEEVDTNAVRYDPEFVKPYESSAQIVQIAEGSKGTATLKQIQKPADR
jgi:protocatechuate 3,4-dioxygenase beta subunit